MTIESSSKQTKVCPTCGTRLSESATRCLVCGSEFAPTAEVKSQKQVQAARMPEITLSLPMAMGLLALFLVIGAVLLFFALSGTGRVTQPTPVPTETQTPTITPTVTETPTVTLAPTATMQPPFEYTVQTGDYCSTIAAQFNVSVNSIIILNNLSANCNLSVNQKLLVPYPTPTVTPLPTSTLSGPDATIAACEKAYYTVQEGDTLSTISVDYNVPMEAIKSYNKLATDNVPLGMTLLIPLCERAPDPNLPTATATLPPPYAAPALLLPADGAAFTLANDTVTLQWATIGTLRENERYMIVVEDLTDGQGRKLVDYVNDTKYTIPVSFRPRDNLPHVLRWWVVTVRQTGTNEQGEPIWTNAGAQSLMRVFSWVGAAVAATPTP